MGCKLNKVCYVNELDALHAMITLIEKGRYGQDWKCYFCKPCGRWHLKTAKLQLHKHFWRPTYQWPKSVRGWFKQRGTIDLWDNE